MKNRIVFRALPLALCGFLTAVVLCGTAEAQHVGGGGHVGGAVGGHAGGYGGWGWGWGGLGLGLYFSALPLYYSTLWWQGVPYYYADDSYYRWDGAVGQYQTVSPPPGLVNPAQPQSPETSDLIAYPKNGQTTEQQSKDKYECHHWAVGQTGFDPTQAGGGSSSAPNRRSDYFRAQAACLEGRGYSVR